MSSEWESEEYRGELSRRVRLIVGALVHADDPDAPAEDPLFRQLVGSPSPFPSKDIVHFLAVMVVIARRKTADVVPDLTLDRVRQVLVDETPAGGDRVRMRQAFNLVADAVTPVADKARLAQECERFAKAFRVNGVATLCYVYYRLAVLNAEARPGLTTEDVLAEWALAEERDLR